MSDPIHPEGIYQCHGCKRIYPEYLNGCVEDHPAPRNVRLAVPNLERLPPGRLAADRTVGPFAHPYVGSDTRQGFEYLTVNWPDDQPDTCVITRAVLLDMIEGLNTARARVYEQNVLLAMTRRDPGDAHDGALKTSEQRTGTDQVSEFGFGAGSPAGGRPGRPGAHVLKPGDAHGGR